MFARGFFFLLLLAISASGQDTGGRVFTSLQDLRALDRSTAEQRFDVDVTGVVTFAHPRARSSFIISDDATGVYVSVNDPANRAAEPVLENYDGVIHPGMRVRVIGKTFRGAFAPVILPGRITYLGMGELPAAKPVTVAELQTGRLDCERVLVRGVIQHAETTAGQIDAARLDVAAVGGHFVAYISDASEFDRTRLIDAEVELSGVALTFYNERGEIVGARVQLNSMRDLAITAAPTADPFAVPAVSLDALLPFSPAAPILHRRRISGTVTVSQPGKWFYLQDGERAVRVTTPDPTPLAPGDRVEVSGFVELVENYAEVREALIRKIGTAPVPRPERITWKDVVGPRASVDTGKTPSHLDGRRVAMEGRLEKVEQRESGTWRLTLDADGHLIFATLANSGGSVAMQQLIPGSDVRITAVCQVQLSGGRPTLSNPVPTGFQLLVQSPEDIAVIRVPPWWTPQRLWLALGGTVAVLALALAWAWLLRRQVAQRSAELAAEISARRTAGVEFEAILRERKRLASDLHDTLEQALTGLALQLEAVDLFQGREPDRSTRHLHLARQFLARSREDVRRSVWNLRAQGLEGRSLEEALRDMLIALTQGSDVTSSSAVDGTPTPLPDLISGNLLLLAQEAVTNALKHAEPDAIAARVSFEAARVEVEVRDDGKGFDPANAPSLAEGHFGLQGMRERMKRLGGTVRIESAPGQGTRITASCPVERESADRLE